MGEPITVGGLAAVFNFIPRTALEFHRAIERGDHATAERLIAGFFMPYLDIRNRQPGYAVSIVKAGVRIAGRPAGAVRPPLTDLSHAESEALAKLIAALGAQ